VYGFNAVNDIHVLTITILKNVSPTQELKFGVQRCYAKVIR